MVIIVSMGVSREREFQAEEIASVKIKAPSLLFLMRVWDLTSKRVKRKNTQRRPPRYLPVGIAELYFQ